MATWLEVLLQICGGGGILGFFSYFLFFRESKRIKGAEALDKDLTNIEKSMKILESRVEYQGKEIKALQEQLSGKNQLIRQLYRERDTLEKKYAQKKSAINCAIGCNPACPVLEKLKEIEAEYLKEQLILQENGRAEQAQDHE